MRSITYAGETVFTTDDVAEALVALTAAVANEGRAEAVSIPIVVPGTLARGEAELVIGMGNDVLSAPADWQRGEPDFTAASRDLRDHPSYPRHRRPDDEADADDASDDSGATGWDPDLDGYQMR